MRVALKLNIVREGGAAHKAGLQSGDYLVSYDGVEITSAEELKDAVGKSTGKSIVSFSRNGKLARSTVESGPLDVSYSEVEIEGTPEWVSNEALSEMVVTTAPSVDGYVVDRQLGVVSSECVFGLSLFKDFFTSLTDFAGGRSKTTQSALREARETCISELKNEALERGANAIIAVDIDYSEFSGQGKSMLLIVATGTAVSIKPL